MSRLLLHLEDRLTLRHQPTNLCPPGPTTNLGSTVVGGAGIRIVSGRAEFTADIRTLPGMSQQEIAQDIDDALAAFSQERPGARVTWEFLPEGLGWLPPTEVAPVLPLVRALRRASGRILGQTPPYGCFPGGSDAISWQAHGGYRRYPHLDPAFSQTVTGLTSSWRLAS